MWYSTVIWQRLPNHLQIRTLAGAHTNTHTRTHAPSHTSLVVQQFLAEKNIPVITQPPYSPDLVPSDFWLFPTPKMGLKGTRFATMDIECNGRAPEDSKRSLPPVLPTMAESMQQLCVCVRACARARVLIWRWLGKRCHMSNHYSAIPHMTNHYSAIPHMSNHYSAIPHFQELFDCSSYSTKRHSDSVYVYIIHLKIKSWYLLK
jgi:hypothetical protein